MTLSPRTTFELGAHLHPDGGCRFCVWGPAHENITLQLISPERRNFPMARDADGYHTATVTDVTAGTLYWYDLAGTERPDPASRAQPDGLHGPSQVIRRDFEWHDHGWAGIPLESYIFYELHIGTYTPEGTFDAVIPHLDKLTALGVTAIEIMPVAQFPGTRNWGYDGAAPYAVQNSYGGADGLKRLVDACHQRGLAVVLDVVYNHLGPEGNYLRDFGPYFTETYHTPWGAALNFDGPQRDHVRRFVVENALMWITEFHIDALRLDATHAMLDFSADPIIEVLTAAVHQRAHELNRRVYLIAENDRSDDRLLRPVELGGVGMDAQWSDDLHHVLHTLLTKESFGYYKDYGQFSQLARALRLGYVFAGEHSPFRGRRHGTFRADLPASKFVVCTQNHDQVGNRMNGDRLSRLVSFEALKLAAGIVLLSPYLPLLFMGEEYGETNPFQFFTSYEDPALQDAVSKGRAKEFEGYDWEGDVPDPQDEQTFFNSRLNHGRREQGHHRVLLSLYTELIHLRKTVPALRQLSKDHLEVTGFEREQTIFMRRWNDDSDICALFNFGSRPAAVTAPIPVGDWRCLLASTEERWSSGESAVNPALPAITGADPLSMEIPPLSFVVYEKQS